MKKFFKRDEVVLALIIAAVFIVFASLNADFATTTNMFSLMRAALISIVFAMGVLLVMISGGIDISFMAIASFSAYCACKICLEAAWDAPLALVFLIAGAFGALLGLANAFLVNKLNLPIFIVTLGTQGLIKGGLLAFVGQDYIADLPTQMTDLSKSTLATATSNAGAEIGLPTAILFPLVLCIVLALVLKYTKFGRAVFAVGGDIDAAKRVGINVNKTRSMTFMLAGIIASMGGVLSVSLMRKAIPTDLIGREMLVIASVILGGGKMEEGRGTVLGAVLGVLLIQMISNNLTLVGVPTFFQQAVLGGIIIVGTIIQFSKNDIRLIRGKKKTSSGIEAADGAGR